MTIGVELGKGVTIGVRDKASGTRRNGVEVFTALAVAVRTSEEAVANSPSGLSVAINPRALQAMSGNVISIIPITRRKYLLGSCFTSFLSCATLISLSQAIKDDEAASVFIEIASSLFHGVGVRVLVGVRVVADILVLVLACQVGQAS